MDGPVLSGYQGGAPSTVPWGHGRAQTHPLRVHLTCAYSVRSLNLGLYVTNCGYNMSVCYRCDCCVHVCLLNHVQLFVTAWIGACLAPLFMEFFRQEYWSRLPLPIPGDLPDPRIEPESLASPA